MDLLENIMEKQKQVGADDLGIMFHLYHLACATAIIGLFVFLDWWMALIIFSVLGMYFVWKY